MARGTRQIVGVCSSVRRGLGESLLCKRRLRNVPVTGAACSGQSGAAVPEHRIGRIPVFKSAVAIGVVAGTGGLVINGRGIHPTCCALCNSRKIDLRGLVGIGIDMGGIIDTSGRKLMAV